MLCVMPGILPNLPSAGLPGFTNPDGSPTPNRGGQPYGPPAPTKLSTANFPSSSRVVTRPGHLPEGAALTKGLHIVWLYQPNDSWKPFLQWVAKWNRSWDAFLVLLEAQHKASGSTLKISFPKSRVINGKWFERKNYDPVKKGLWFLVEFK